MEIPLDRRFEKPMKARADQGQSLVESVLLLPPILLLIYGACVCIRSSSLDSAAESAAHAETIRCGRRLSSLNREIPASMGSIGQETQIRAENRSISVPSAIPLPNLVGRTFGRTDVHWIFDDMPGLEQLPSLRLTRNSQMSVDCWDRGSGSGKNIRRAVKGVVASGVLH